MVSSELSARPSDAEWATATERPLARAGSRCAAHQVREWVRLRCKVYATEVELIGGSAEGVTMSHSETYNVPSRSWWGGWHAVDDALIELPLRRGDRRIFQLVGSQFVRWGGVDLDVELVVSALWLSDEPAAVITVH
jgi:hypothetical protein